MFTYRGLIAFAIIILLVLADVASPLRVENIHIELRPEPILFAGPLTITNTLLGSWLAMVLLVILALLSTRRLVDTPAPLSLQNIVEALVEALLNFMRRFVGERAWGFFPVVGTFFLYILFMNWLSIMPGFGSIGFTRTAQGERIFVPLFRGGTTDLNTTVALAFCSVFSAQVLGIRSLGFRDYLLQYIAVGKYLAFFRQLVREGRANLGLLVGGTLDVFVGLLELFDQLTKIISFAFRLFGNVFGGEVLLAVMAFLLPFLVSTPFMAMELFTGAIQAFVFAVLSTAFFGQATAEHRHQGENAESDEGQGPEQPSP
ncbi:MAG: F0F1 ATP synthase subunit A [Chloroflexi bacterium]|nr:F0F1 ATP synthase subunit A [Chloroflexota bacterium]